MVFNIKKIIIYILLVIVSVFTLRIAYLFFSGDIVFVKETRTVLEGQWVSNKEMTLKFYENEMGHLKQELGKIKYTINGIRFKYEYDDNVNITQFFRVLSKNDKEISIELYSFKFEIFGIILLFFSEHTSTFHFSDGCLVLSTEYFCK